MFFNKKYKFKVELHRFNESYHDTGNILTSYTSYGVINIPQIFKIINDLPFNVIDIDFKNYHNGDVTIIIKCKSKDIIDVKFAICSGFENTIDSVHIV